MCVYIYIHTHIYTYIYIISYKNPRSLRNRDLEQGCKLGSEAGKPGWTFTPAVPRRESTPVVAPANTGLLGLENGSIHGEPWMIVDDSG